MGNDYESETVSVTFAPTEKYRVDSVVYRWDEFESWDNSIELQDAFTIDNTASSEPASVVVSPFRNAKRTVVSGRTTSTIVGRRSSVCRCPKS